MRDGRRKPERVSSLGLVNRLLGKAYLFDATPDLPSQIHSLTGGRLPDAIFLTHAHVGHYTGLMYLGRESVDASGVAIYATDKMTAFLRGNGPWSWLADKGNITPKLLVADRAVDLGDGIKVTALTVPHRDELSDTVGFIIEGPTGRRSTSRISISGRNGRGGSVMSPTTSISRSSTARSRRRTRFLAARSPISRIR